MKKISSFLLLIAILPLQAQEIVVDLSLQPAYTQEVFFDFASDTAENFPVDSWEIAFMQSGTFDFSERINTGLGIEVYQASDNPADYESIDPNNRENWIRLYNNDTIWTQGAFDQGSATYGWGEYDAVSHHVEGTIVFVLEYPNGAFRKFMITDFYNGYTFKYASWDETSSSWIDEREQSLPNDENPESLFNYYSLTDNTAVGASPNLDDWDLVFADYMTDVQGTMYPVLGALQNPNVKVAVTIDKEAQEEDLAFSEKINTVGYDWKSYEDGNYTIDSDTYYFLKYEDGTVYRFHFLSFDGSETGDFSLGYEEVTDEMAVEVFDKNNSLSLYPNPSSDGNISLLFDGNQSGKAQVKVFDMNGRLVKQQTFNAHQFSDYQLDLTGASSGVYWLHFTTGPYSTTKKLILN